MLLFITGTLAVADTIKAMMMLDKHQTQEAIFWVLMGILMALCAIVGLLNKQRG